MPARLHDAPLRRDVRLLGELLGEALRAHGGPRLFAIEERIRGLAKARRREGGGRGRADAALRKVLRGLTLEEMEGVIRAFGHYFELVNVAEQNHRVRRARAHAKDSRPQRGSVADCLSRARRAGIGADAVRDSLRSLRVTLSLTAHPSQVVRRTVLSRLREVAGILEERDRCQSTPVEAAAALAALRESVTMLWLTDPLRHERPRVGDEVKTIEWYAEEVLARTSVALEESLASGFEAVFREPLGFVPCLLRLHAWPGGDMDGNPEVTPAIFEDALRAYRARGLAFLVAELRRLGGRLSLSRRYVRVPASLRRSIDADERRFPGLAAREGFRTEGEPFRRKLRLLEDRLGATLAEVQRRRAEAFPQALPDPQATVARGPSLEQITAEELEAELARLARCLREATGDPRASRRVESLLGRVRAQGLDLAELELRAHVAEVRVAAATSAETRIAGALRRLADARRESPGGGCGALILSMAGSKEDLLAALSCARAAGLWDERRGCAHLDVVPLFETFDALSASPQILRSAFADARYRRHVRARGGQQVMLGYSDSGKEVGLLAAGAALRRAQLGLTRVAREARLPLLFFHGRGETVARGGGPAQAALLALPSGSVAGHFKATEQGEALDHKYSRPPLALRTLELYVGGALLHTLGVLESPGRGDEERFEAFFGELAEAGRRAYRSLVWEEPRFAEFYEAASPIREIAELKIGSRPSRRSAGGLETLRAIPWVFAWNQNRAILPGWYGVGAAFEEASRRRGGAALLEAMYRRWPFFRALVDNVEMVLAKADLEIAARYAELAPRPAREAVWPRIAAEHARTQRWILRLTGSRRLLDYNPSLQRSIALRNPYVDPLSLLQVELLRRKRAGDRGCDRALLLTLGGIASGLRNTG